MQGYQKEETFELPVVYDGKERLLPARLVQMGYTYSIFVQFDGGEIIFEPDEERKLRAVVEMEKGTSVSPQLVRTIGKALEQALRL